MIRAFAALMLAVASTACSASITIGDKPDDGRGSRCSGRYENSELGFSFDCPDGLPVVDEALDYSTEVGTGERRRLAFLAFGEVEPSTNLIGATVEVQQMQRSVEAGQIDDLLAEFDGVYEQVAGQSGGALREKDDATLDGVDARRYVLDVERAGKPLRVEVHVTGRGDHAFTIQCQGNRATFDETQEQCRDILDSWRFTD